MADDKFAKLISWRQKQEKKNDQLRVHKNKIQSDRLKIETDILESTKAVSQREYGSKRDELIKMLEKLYTRQMALTEQKKKDQAKRIEQERIRKQRRMALEQERMMNEQNAQMERHGRMAQTQARNLLVNKEKEKTFMAKVKMLSAGYKDNDPPLSYYKRKGMVPPERAFTPLMSARAQSEYGGGHRPPSSLDHLRRTPAETAYGLIDEPSKDVESPPKTPEDAINTVSEANNMLTNGLNRRRGAVIGGVAANGKNAAGLVALKLTGEDAKKPKKTEPTPEEAEGEQKEEEGEEGEDEPRETEDAGPGTTQSSPEPMQRRRENVTSLKINDASKMMRFGVRPQTSDGASKKSSNRNKSSPSVLTNIEAERIRKKMMDKSLCLRRERADRAASAMGSRQQRSRSSARPTHSARSVTSSSGFVMETYRSRCNSARPTSALPPSTHVRTYFPPKSDHQKKIMASYINQCRRGQLIPDVNLAKKTLLLASKDHVEDLQKDVKSFVLR